MKKILNTVLLLFSIVMFSQGNYEKGMTKAFELWENGKMDEAQNIFERIANAENDKWLPHYYIAQLNSIKTWGEKDENIVKSQLAKAQEHLNTAMSLNKNNPELMVLQANVYTNWVAFDGMTYGMKYSAKISELYNKALKIAPENPRVVLGKAQWDMGSARYFGQDTKPFCKDIEKSLELFESFKSESKFYPNWGKEGAEEALKECKS
ncbi:MAG: hypothetical protein AAF688_06480 [Bacteroidota bacterium]